MSKNFTVMELPGLKQQDTLKSLLNYIISEATTKCL